MLGTYALSSGYYDAYYVKAQKVRTLIKRDFDRAFERFDVLVAPTSPDRRVPDRREDRRPGRDVPDRRPDDAGQLRRRARRSSCPAAESEGLPVGLQLIGPSGGEETLLRAAYAYEQSLSEGR